MVAHNDLLRVIELQGTLGQLVARGKRDPKAVADVLQIVNDEPDFATLLGLQKNYADPHAEAIALSLDDWIKFYSGEGIKIKAGDLVIPSAPDFPHWLVVEPAAFTPNQGFAAMKKRGMKPWKVIDNLDEFKHTEEFKGVRAFFVRARIEADEELKNRSAQMNWDDGIPTMTLPARSALGCVIHDKAGVHLDCENVTLCSGSRLAGGDVPYVYWYSAFAWVSVSYWHRVHRCGDLRARQQFS